MSDVRGNHIHVHRRTAFTLVEAVIATVIVSVMLVAALGTVGTSRLVQQKVSLSSRGRLLAESLLAEIIQQAYQDPDETVAFGAESGEKTNNRSDFDDVDDYHGWSQSPPKTKSGSAIPASTGWTRTVTVVWVDPAAPAQTETSESGAKRITVTARYSNVAYATLVAVRTNHQ